MSGTWRAGAAKADISPREDLFPLPQREGMRYERVGEPIFVRALALESKDGRVLCLSFELFGLPFAQELRKALCERFELSEGEVLLCDTYNHCAPREDLYRFDTSHCGKDVQERTNAYFADVQGAAMDAAQAAFEALAPACLSFGQTFCAVGINRDEQTDGGFVLGKNPEGPRDRTLTALLVKEERTGRVIAMAVHFALYGNMCYLADADGVLWVGGDLPGRVSSILEARYPGTTALWLCGAAGDQDPLLLSTYATWTEDGARSVRKMTHAEAALIRECQAQWIAGDALRAIASAQPVSGCALCGIHARLNLPGKAGSGVPAEIMALRLGDWYLACVSGAPGAKLGEAICSSVAKAHVLAVTHAGCLTGYLVDEAGCAQETFEKKNMLAFPGAYETEALPRLRRMAQLLRDGDLN